MSHFELTIVWLFHQITRALNVEVTADILSSLSCTRGPIYQIFLASS